MEELNEWFWELLVLVHSGQDAVVVEQDDVAVAISCSPGEPIISDPMEASVASV